MIRASRISVKLSRPWVGLDHRRRGRRHGKKGGKSRISLFFLCFFTFIYPRLFFALPHIFSLLLDLLVPFFILHLRFQATWKSPCLGAHGVSGLALSSSHYTTMSRDLSRDPP